MIMKQWRGLVAASMGLTLWSTSVHAAETNAIASMPTQTETAAQREARMRWWHEARFGMFVHWGLYAVPAGVWDGKDIGGIGEWIMHNAKIPLADYQQLPKQFDPEKFNADQWVSIAKAAGVKYIVITAKHHDGFAMFHSQASPFNIYDATPFKRDPLKELAAACKKQGVRLGFYYSQAQDWNHPGGAAAGGHWDKAQDGDVDAYVRDIAVPQVKELLTNYGPIAELWWDTPQKMSPESIASLKSALALQPNIVSNNRLGGNEEGDFSTPEQYIPANGLPGKDWETCMTINGTWGFKSKDLNWKSTETLLHNLVDIASKGGNYLLNVGPTAEGEIPAPEVERLQQMGQWLKLNGDAIYGTTASPFKKQLPWGRATQKPGKLYLEVFNWPQDGVLTVPITNHVDKAYLLTDTKKKLAMSVGDNGLTLQLPTTAPDPIASVVVLDVKGEIVPLAPPAPMQAADGTISLMASDAEIVGSKTQLEGGNPPNIGYWTDAKDFLRWHQQVVKPGDFDVSITYACDPATAGSEYTIAVGDKTLDGKIESTGGWGTYQTVKIGTVHIDQPGLITATLTPKTKPGPAVMNLRSVSLTPVKL